MTVGSPQGSRVGGPVQRRHQVPFTIPHRDPVRFGCMVPARQVQPAVHHQQRQLVLDGAGVLGRLRGRDRRAQHDVADQLGVGRRPRRRGSSARRSARRRRPGARPSARRSPSGSTSVSDASASRGAPFAREHARQAAPPARPAPPEWRRRCARPPRPPPAARRGCIERRGDVAARAMEARRPTRSGSRRVLERRRAAAGRPAAPRPCATRAATARSAAAALRS